MDNQNKTVFPFDDFKKELPEWYLIFEEGDNFYADGVKVFVDFESFESVIARTKNRGIDPVFDYEHQTEGDGEAPAAGWIKDWKWEKGIWAKVEWTQKAAKMLLNKEYRYFSPVFLHSKRHKKNCLFAIEHIALTNYPLTNGIKPLVAKKTKEEIVDLIELLKEIEELKLSDEATAEDVIEAIEALIAEAAEKEGDSEEEKEELKEENKVISKALNLGKNSDLSLIVAKIKGLKAGLKENTDLSAKVAGLEDKIAEGDAKKLVAKYSNKLTPSMLKQKNDEGNQFWFELAKKDAKGFEVIVASMPVQIPDPLQKQNRKVSTGITAESAEIAKMMGNDPKKLMGEG